jgi:serine/threonine protein kinase
MNPMLRHNLQNEIEIMKTIRDVEGTIQLFDVIQLDSSPLVFLVMELAKETLMEYLLRRKKAFSEEEARDVFVQLAKTLNTLHQRNIVHRDIKLENIYISLSKYTSQFEFFLSIFQLFLY